MLLERFNPNMKWQLSELWRFQSRRMVLEGDSWYTVNRGKIYPLSKINQLISMECYQTSKECLIMFWSLFSSEVNTWERLILIRESYFKYLLWSLKNGPFPDPFKEIANNNVFHARMLGDQLRRNSISAKFHKNTIDF